MIEASRNGEKTSEKWLLLLFFSGNWVDLECHKLLLSNCGWNGRRSCAVVIQRRFERESQKGMGNKNGTIANQTGPNINL